MTALSKNLKYCNNNYYFCMGWEYHLKDGEFYVSWMEWTSLRTYYLGLDVS